MKNLLIGVVIGAVVSSLVWYFKAGATVKESPVKEPVVKEKAKPKIVDFLDTTKSLVGISNMFINKDSAKKYVGFYLSDHDANKDKKVTFSIFFDRSVCEILGNYYLNIAGPEVSGIRIYNIQYNRLMPSETHGSHRDPKQQTILLVPTGTAKEPLWDEWDPSNFAPPYSKFFDALNHGELCPKICPPTNKVP